MAEGVLRRKLRIIHKEPEAQSAVEKGWRLALARMLNDRAKIEARVGHTALSRLSLAEVVDMPPDLAMILMLDGPEEGLGVLVLSAPVFTTLVEVLTLGRCAPAPPDPRKATRVDAAMIAPLADHVLALLEEALADQADLVWAGGFRFASALEDARPLGLLLEDAPYCVLRAELALAGGTRQGDVMLVLPAQGRGPQPSPGPDRAEQQALQADFSRRLARQVGRAELRLDAVIGRLSMPLAQVMALRAGQVLALDGASVDRIGLCALDGRQVALCRLGQTRGMRALRLSPDAAELSPAGAALPLAATGTG